MPISTESTVKGHLHIEIHEHHPHASGDLLGVQWIVFRQSLSEQSLHTISASVSEKKTYPCRTVESFHARSAIRPSRSLRRYEKNRDLNLP